MALITFAAVELPDENPTGRLEDDAEGPSFEVVSSFLLCSSAFHSALKRANSAGSSSCGGTADAGADGFIQE